MFYHIHQAAGPPPPSRYYSESSASAAPDRPPLALLERPIKGKRKRANAQQLDVLNKVFASTSFPSTELRNRLARDLGMTPRTVQIWFQNKRQASRQRDGHHSRNTKSMAATQDGCLGGACSHESRRSDSLDSLLSPSPSQSQSPSQSPLIKFAALQPRVATSSQELMALVTAATQAAPNATAAAAADASAASPAWSDDSGAAVGRKHEPRQMMAAAAAAAASTVAPAKARQHADDDDDSREAYAKRHHHGHHSHSAADANRYAHTRNDQWFTDSTPTKLDYLYGHTSQVVVMSARAHPPALGRAIHAPWDRAQPPSQSQPLLRRPRLSPFQRPLPAAPAAADASAVRRSMSLMDVLNAPPEQRRLPPLPPM
ncbi:hypothetical protein GGF38_001802 [Coemansia sp. RSA 25]|nr:hypothetical protein GGF38_001802 [Coemansia sp. RSA 25]